MPDNSNALRENNNYLDEKHRCCLLGCDFWWMLLISNVVGMTWVDSVTRYALPGARLHVKASEPMNFTNIFKSLTRSGLVSQASTW